LASPTWTPPRSAPSTPAAAAATAMWGQPGHRRMSTAPLATTTPWTPCTRRESRLLTGEQNQRLIKIKCTPWQAAFVSSGFVSYCILSGRSKTKNIKPI